jgi:hypothetical protein
MKSNVKNYTTKQLLNRMRSLSSYTHIPKGHHVIVVRSNEDAYNVYDDKLYLFMGETHIATMSCTSNSGAYGLANFAKWNKLGTAVIKFDEIYYDAFLKSDGKLVKHHNRKMQCLRQVKPLKYYRDNNKNKKIDESGQIFEGINATNIHTNSYTARKGIVSWLIGGWSTGCTVVNNLTMYYDVLLARINFNEPVTYTGLKEF